MEAYEARKPAYYGTPAVNLIYALDESVRQIVAEGMDARFRRHRLVGEAFKSAMDAIGLKEVPVRREISAHTLTAVYFPDGIDAQLLGKIASHGVVVAGGLHPAIRARYFRVGHMGAVTVGDVLATVAAIERGLLDLGHPVERGAGVAVAQNVLTQL